MDAASRAPHERFGWRMFRPPPATALLFGAMSGAIAGLMIVWKIAVLIRGTHIVRRRIAQEIERRTGV